MIEIPSRPFFMIPQCSPTSFLSFLIFSITAFLGVSIFFFPFSYVTKLTDPKDLSIFRLIIFLCFIFVPLPPPFFFISPTHPPLARTALYHHLFVLSMIFLSFLVSYLPLDVYSHCIISGGMQVLLTIKTPGVIKKDKLHLRTQIPKVA